MVKNRFLLNTLKNRILFVLRIRDKRNTNWYETEEIGGYFQKPWLPYQTWTTREHVRLARSRKFTTPEPGECLILCFAGPVPYSFFMKDVLSSESFRGTGKAFSSCNGKPLKRPPGLRRGNGSISVWTMGQRTHEKGLLRRENIRAYIRTSWEPREAVEERTAPSIDFTRCCGAQENENAPRWGDLRPYGSLLALRADRFVPVRATVSESVI